MRKPSKLLPSAREKGAGEGGITQADSAYLQQALAIAAQALYTATPNPRVGCVLVNNNMVIGTGFTQPIGQDHAEVQALKDARAGGHDPRGATAYVSLEPCCHYGHTPPCVKALIEARIARVVVAMEDPNPLVSGRGLQALREAGIAVSCGLLESEARELNLGFISRMTRQRPWVRTKIASSLDGHTALPTGESQWITGPAARADGHAWRARACAILTGIGTVRRDNPRLTVRDVATPRQPLRIVADSRLGLPLNAQILAGETIVVACALSDHELTTVYAEHAARLRASGAQIISVPGSNGQLDLPDLLTWLGQQEINELHVEAGATLNGALLRADCIDEVLLYLAPTLLGNGSLTSPGLFNLPTPPTLAERMQLRFQAIDMMGDDVRILARLSR